MDKLVLKEFVGESHAMNETIDNLEEMVAYVKAYPSTTTIKRSTQISAQGALGCLKALRLTMQAEN